MRCFAVLFALLAVCTASAAPVLPARDVDALMWSSHDVIIAKVLAHQIDPANPKKVARTTVEVMQVIKGEMAAGEEVEFFNIGSFRLPPDLPAIPGPARAVPPHSSVVIFTRRQTAAPRPAEVLENGLWFVHAGLVYEFKQHWPKIAAGIPAMSPWPGYTARSRAVDPEYAPMRESNLAKVLDESQQRVAGYHQLLDGPADAAKVERYLELYEARRAVENVHHDPIGYAAAAQFSRAAPIERVLEYSLQRPGDFASPFNAAFQTRDGREYLLKQLEDSRASAERLLGLAKIIDAIDWPYTLQQRNHDRAGEPPTHERLFERCAKVAVNRSETEAASVLIRVIASAAESMRSARYQSETLLTDVDAAQKVILAATEWKSADARFRAAILARNVQPPGAAMKHPAVLTVVRGIKVQKQQDLSVLEVSFNWNSNRPAGSTALKPSVVVRSTDGKFTVEFSNRQPPVHPQRRVDRGDFQRSEPGGGKSMIDFEMDQPLADGEYDVFLRYRDGDVIVADGVTARLNLKR